MGGACKVQSDFKKNEDGGSSLKAAFKEYTIPLNASEKLEFCPTQKSFCLKNSVSLSFIAASAYVEPNVVIKELHKRGFDKNKIKFFNIPMTDSQAVWLEREDQQLGIIAIRGTESNNDKLQDARVIKRSLKLAGKRWGRVHSGFRSSYLSLRKQIIPYIESRIKAYREKGQELRIWGTGHSLGAAIATLFHAEFMATGNTNFQGSYTVGSPRVGGERFADRFNSEMMERNIPLFRLRYRKDMVTMLPPHIRPSRYRHVGIMGYIHSASGELYIKPSKIKEIGGLDAQVQGVKSQDHIQSRYYESLRARLDRTKEECNPNADKIVDEIYEE